MPTKTIAYLRVSTEQQAERGVSLDARRAKVKQIDTRSAAGRLVLNVLASVSQWEREAIGKRTATALQHKASQGEYTCGQAPYGRRVAADGERLEPDAQEQEARAVARQLRSQGLSLRAVAAELERRGVRSRTGRGFAPVQVKRMVG
jgi:site-specific DNA recombinase